jgi:hypothetical protein
MEVERLSAEVEAGKARLAETVRRKEEAEQQLDCRAAALKELQICLAAKERELAVSRETSLCAKMEAERENSRWVPRPSGVVGGGTCSCSGCDGLSCKPWYCCGWVVSLLSDTGITGLYRKPCAAAAGLSRYFLALLLLGCLVNPSTAIAGLSCKPLYCCCWAVL